MRKVVINTLICLVCTAIIFYLHFAVYDGMLLQEPFFTGSICAVCIVFALRSNIDDQTYTTQWNYPTAFSRLQLYRFIIEPYLYCSRFLIVIFIYNTYKTVFKIT